MTPQQAGYTTASDLDQCDDREVFADIREESIYRMLASAVLAHSRVCEPPCWRSASGATLCPDRRGQIPRTRVYVQTSLR